MIWICHKKDKKQSKTDKTEHEIGKSVRNQGRRRMHPKWANWFLFEVLKPSGEEQEERRFLPKSYRSLCDCINLLTRDSYGFDFGRVPEI
ncbi:hypothetical protein Tco_0616341 [Tanacetum coccineum]